MKTDDRRRSALCACPFNNARLPRPRRGSCSFVVDARAGQESARGRIGIQVPSEFTVCNRDDNGASIIPALSAEEIQEIVAETGDEPLGELWFSGVLGGDITEDGL